ncbi:MAG: 50S ribosomal protein L9 [Spirochaetes bacterium]|nr:50S ribosomal protein L9 [Spirochaetota bacterium]
MKVILQKDVPNLGDAGDIKEVAEGYARNYLLPRNLVLIASESSRREAEHQRKLVKLKKEKRKKESEKILGKIDGVTVQFAVQVGEEGKLFGSVTTMDIARRLKEQGFQIDKKKIHLENPIRQEGEFEVAIRLDEGLTAKIKVIVAKE